MLRYRMEYLYIPKSAKFRFTVLVPGPLSVGAYQAARAADEWLLPACPPLYRWDCVMLSAVFLADESWRVKMREDGESDTEISAREYRPVTE